MFGTEGPFPDLATDSEMDAATAPKRKLPNPASVICMALKLYYE